MKDPFPTWAETRRQSTEMAVSRYPRADVERLIRRLTPLAKVPHFVGTTSEAEQATSDWTKQGHNFADAFIVWQYLLDKYEADRDRATREDRGMDPGPGAHLAHGLRRTPDHFPLTAREYYTLKGDDAALKAIEFKTEQPDLLTSLADLAIFLLGGKMPERGWGERDGRFNLGRPSIR